MMAGGPPPAGVTLAPAVLGARPALEITPEGGAAGGTILYFHGGNWVVGSPATAQQLTAALVLRTGTRAVSLDYRLAPEYPFPAAIEDAVAAYRDLLEHGIPAGQVVLAGDSAGEGLAVVALLAARDAGLPLPAGAVAFSPVLDATHSDWRPSRPCTDSPAPADRNPRTRKGNQMPQSLPEPLTGLLHGASLCFISTVMPDGSPQLTQTWVDTDGTHILINTAEGFQKVRNIRRDPRVAVAIADPSKPMLYYSVRGEVSSITAVGAADHVEELSQRYFGMPFPWPNGRDETRLILTINAHKIYTPMG